MNATEKIIDKLLDIARPEILKEFSVDSCIISTAIGIEVLSRFGVIAEPLPVRTVVFNKPFADRIKRGENPYKSDLAEWTKQDNSYSLGIGYGFPQPNKWAGHLVILAEKKYLIDLSIDQANRPQYDISLEPYCMVINHEDLSKKPIYFETRSCVVGIELLSNNGYLASPDWIFATRRSKTIKNILKKM